MFGCYCADPALETAIVDALEFYGLEASPAVPNRRTPPAGTLGEQMRRTALGSEVLALVRRSAPVGEDDRRLIYRIVDSACQRSEEADLPARVRGTAGASIAAVVAYAAAGGGALGSFESFRRTFVSSAELLEPAVEPAVCRQDVKPAPVTNPSRRPDQRNPPGSAAPVKTNPTRTIRSSRWSAGRKAVRS